VGRKDICALIGCVYVHARVLGVVPMIYFQPDDRMSQPDDLHVRVCVFGLVVRNRVFASSFPFLFFFSFCVHPSGEEEDQYHSESLILPDSPRDRSESEASTTTAASPASARKAAQPWDVVRAASMQLFMQFFDFLIFWCC
jgi:hypothetical protein